MMLPVFEAYFLDGDDNGYPQEHWDKIIEQYDDLTGEKGGSDVKFNIWNYTNLAMEFAVWHSALDTLVLLAQNNCYAPSICENLRTRFKRLSFSRETLASDIEAARSKLKAVELQIKSVAALLPQGEPDMKRTFFDDILQAYESVFTVYVPKEQLTVQQFAIRYKRLKDRIEQDAKSR